MLHWHFPKFSKFIVTGGRASGGSDTEDVRVTGRRKSTPNLFSFEGQGSESEPKRSPSFTYEDLYQKQLLQKHHHHGRRSRRMREYDSDTGYRSDREMQHFHSQYAKDGRDDLSVRSQPTMSRPHRRSHGREGGYASDLEVYAGRGRGWGGRDGGSNVATPSPMPRPVMYPLYPTHSLPQDLNARTSSGAPELASPHLHRPPCLTVPNSRPGSGSGQHPAGPPSPSQFSGNTMLDQSTPVTTPVTTAAPQGFPASSQPGSSIYSQAGGRGRDQDVQRELYTVLEERNRKTTPQDMRVRGFHIF